MKKILLGFISLMLVTSVYALDVKTYVRGAYNYASFTERADTGQSEISSNGIDLTISSFFGENWGFYLYTGYLFPNKLTTYSSGTTTTVTSTDWDHAMLISAIIGPAYKYSINDQFEIMGALGVHLAQFSFSSYAVASLNSSFGIGGDIGLRYLPTKNFDITAGCVFSHDFAANTEITIRGYGTTEASGSYNFGSFRPYLGIGFTFSEIIN